MKRLLTTLCIVACCTVTALAQDSSKVIRYIERSVDIKEPREFITQQQRDSILYHPPSHIEEHLGFVSLYRRIEEDVQKGVLHTTCQLNTVVELGYYIAAYYYIIGINPYCPGSEDAMSYYVSAITIMGRELLGDKPLEEFMSQFPGLY